MAKLRVGGLTVEEPPTPPRLRIGGVSLAGTAVPATSKLRLGGLTVAGPVPLTSRLRVGGLTVAGPTAVIVKALPNLTNGEPGNVVRVTASLVSGGAADSWTWRPVSGPNTAINGTGETVDITLPGDFNGTTVTIGVRATVDGTTSPEVTFTISVNAMVNAVWSPADQLWFPTRARVPVLA